MLDLPCYHHGPAAMLGEKLIYQPRIEETQVSALGCTVKQNLFVIVPRFIECACSNTVSPLHVPALQAFGL